MKRDFQPAVYMMASKRMCVTALDCRGAFGASQ